MIAYRLELDQTRRENSDISKIALLEIDLERVIEMSFN